ncbi:MAG: TonB-dependent receptor [Bacteroidetes bacterium]|nr:TonB-dependent receptor [Bacteroidota bacterium]
MIFCLLLLQLLPAQHVLSVFVKDKTAHTPVAGAVVSLLNTPQAAFTDSLGIAHLEKISEGAQVIIVSGLGYYRQRIPLTFPLPSENVLVVELEMQTEEMEDVIIVSSRNDIAEEKSPTRVEVIGEDEVEERSNDKPSDVSHVVREQPGVQVQRTSATSGTMNIRLQGLRGRYVQILKDGFPLFGGFASVISVNQIPPIDIRQVEIIKGPASTLYGGDAIAGVINFISKMPSELPVYDVMANVESAMAADAGIYFSQKKKFFGYSLLGMYRYQKEKDWDGDNFSETPLLQRFNLSPQFYFDLSERCVLNVGLNYTHETRTGGALPSIRHQSDTAFTYFDQNKTDHASANLKLEYDFNAQGKLTVRSAYNYFKRSLEIPLYLFAGVQMGSVSEINYRFSRAKHVVVAGVDFRTDIFKEGKDSSSIPRNYKYLTAGLFLQYLYNFTEKTSVEAGMRLDYNNTHGVFPLPHVAFRQKWNEVFTTRLNVGMGYKLPTIFQDESEERAFVRVAGMASSVKPELSLGGTLDLRVKAPVINGFQISLHQLYFLTHIFKPLQMTDTLNTNCTGIDCYDLSYTNLNGFQQSKGIETGLSLSYRGFKTSLVYTLTDNNFMRNKVRSVAPLTSKHVVYLLAGYEIKNFSVDVDCYYFSDVKLSNGRTGQGYWELGINTQLSFKHVLLFANLENILNLRQTTYGPIVSSGYNPARPVFAEIYAPLEGPLFNFGTKIRLGAFSKNKSAAGIEKLRDKD